MTSIVLIVLSILPVFLLGRYIYKTDFEKEPTGLLVGLFLMGIGSVAVTLVTSEILFSIFPFFATMPSDIVSLIPYVFIGVALIEEFSKWMFVYIFDYHHYEFNHAYDAIVYDVFVSLGFACLENIMYVLSNGISTAILRGITAVPGHACFGVLSGYYLGLAKTADKNKNEALSKKNKLKSIIFPILAHGLYDYLIFGSVKMNLFLIVFIAFVIWLFSSSIGKVKQMANILFDVREDKYKKQVPVSPQGTHQYRFCPICGEKVVGAFCPICGHQHIK